MIVSGIENENGNATRPEPTVPPPRMPPSQRRPPRRSDDNESMFAEEFKPLDAVTVSGVTDALLKRPARLAYEVLQGRASRVRLVLLGISCVGLLACGVVMGCFSGGAQLWAVPIKLVAGVLLSGIICLPSLYILSALAGSRLTLGDVWGLMLMALALAVLLLTGFAPVAWLFSQSTGAAGWMGLLHLLLWMAALGFGYRLLKSAVEHTGGRACGSMKLWAFVLLAVLFQMSTVMRPLIGPYKPLQVGEKRFFVQHWMRSME